MTLSTYEKVKRPDKKADNSSCSSFSVSELLEPQQSTPEYGRYAYNFSNLPTNDPTAVASERSVLIGQLGSSGSGKSLDSKTRGRMETDFGYNFGSVRVHTDNYATNLTNALNAKATCYGQDIYFGKNQFAPNTKEGTNLLKHELNHYQQQNQSGTKKIQNKPKKDSTGSLEPSPMVFEPFSVDTDDQPLVDCSTQSKDTDRKSAAIKERAEQIAMWLSENDPAGVANKIIDETFYALDKADTCTFGVADLKSERPRPHVKQLLLELSHIMLTVGPSGEKLEKPQNALHKLLDLVNNSDSRFSKDVKFKEIIGHDDSESLLPPSTDFGMFLSNEDVAGVVSDLKTETDCSETLKIFHKWFKSDQRDYGINFLDTTNIMNTRVGTLCMLLSSELLLEDPLSQSSQKRYITAFDKLLIKTNRLSSSKLATDETFKKIIVAYLNGTSIFLNQEKFTEVPYEVNDDLDALEIDCTYRETKLNRDIHVIVEHLRKIDTDPMAIRIIFSTWAFIDRTKRPSSKVYVNRILEALAAEAVFMESSEEGKVGGCMTALDILIGEMGNSKSKLFNHSFKCIIEKEPYYARYRVNPRKTVDDEIIEKCPSVEKNTGLLELFDAGIRKSRIIENTNPFAGLHTELDKLLTDKGKGNVSAELILRLAPSDLEDAAQTEGGRKLLVRLSKEIINGCEEEDQLKQITRIVDVLLKPDNKGNIGDPTQVPLATDHGSDYNYSGIIGATWTRAEKPPDIVCYDTICNRPSFINKVSYVSWYTLNVFLNTPENESDNTLRDAVVTGGASAVIGGPLLFTPQGVLLSAAIGIAVSLGWNKLSESFRSKIKKCSKGMKSNQYLKIEYWGGVAGTEYCSLVSRSEVSPFPNPDKTVKGVWHELRSLNLSE